MSVVLEIPDHVAHALRVPAIEQRQQLMTELAVALYARGILSFGKARELTPLNQEVWRELQVGHDYPEFTRIRNALDAQWMTLESLTNPYMCGKKQEKLCKFSISYFVPMWIMAAAFVAACRIRLPETPNRSH